MPTPEEIQAAEAARKQQELDAQKALADKLRQQAKRAVVQFTQLLRGEKPNGK